MSLYPNVLYNMPEKWHGREFSLNKRTLPQHRKKDKKAFIPRFIWKYDDSFMEWQRYRVTSKKGDIAVICYFPAHNNQITNV